MNYDRQIAAESLQIFNFCSLKLWSYCTDLNQNFTRRRDIRIANNQCILQNDVSFCFKMTEQRVKTVNFDVCKQAPKLIRYHSNASLIIEEIISVLQSSYIGLPAQKMWLRYLVRNANFCSFLKKGVVFQKSVFALVISGVTGPILIKFAQYVEKILNIFIHR